MREASSSRRRSSTATLSTVSWDTPWATWDHDLPPTPPAADTPTHTNAGYLHIPANGPPHFVPVTAIPNSPPLHHHHIHAATGPIYHDVLPVPNAWRHISTGSRSASGMHWGYIAFFYLTQHMHRWERFVFRFDRQFSSINAMKNMAGEHTVV